ncbi:MAG: hypothetical protein CVV57_01480 [Tenericutes bacterium HGW-Tenericutes-2]|jgi:hypothetical protein|nr:MAG: hypothetical protein CVV57_01480 [Tenericutes bacterium HGW-Tenericutes-2]
MDIRKTASDQEIIDYYLERLKQTKENVSEFQKKSFLMSKEIYRLVESNQNDKNAYLNPKDGKYWKKEHIKVSDEEFIRIKKFYDAYEENSKSIESNQPAAKTVGSIIIILGILFAIIMSTVPYIGVTIGIVVGVFSFLFGLLYITLGNTISSIDKVYNSLEKIRNRIEKDIN